VRDDGESSPGAAGTSPGCVPLVAPGEAAPPPVPEAVAAGVGLAGGALDDGALDDGALDDGFGVNVAVALGVGVADGVGVGVGVGVELGVGVEVGVGVGDGDPPTNAGCGNAVGLRPDIAICM
jgi:hypothetical protein